LGIHQVAVNLSSPPAEAFISVGDITGKKSIFERGNKFFELSNHLGNVLVVVSDRKTSLANTGNTALVSRYRPVVVSVQDYYAFGMVMPQRQFSAGAYRYGFNGKENDNEVSGSGNQYDYGFRIYNPRLGRFLSTDPLFKSYPELTPYQFASNTPIKAIDLDGLEAKGPEISFGERMQLGLAYLIVKFGELGNQMQERDGYERGSNSEGIAYAMENFGNQIMFVHGHMEMQQSALSGQKGNPTASSTIRTQGEVFSTNKLPSQVYKSFWSLNNGRLSNNPVKSKPFSLINVGDALDAGDVVRDANNIIVGRAHLSAGEAHLWIKTKGTSFEGRGADVFASLVKKLEEYDDVTSIAGIWSKGDMGDNLKTFTKLLGENKSTKEAAFGTFTGKVARRLGYTEVSVSSILRDSEGNITNVNLSFSKHKGK
jgi:RHS repeat-associated protein